MEPFSFIKAFLSPLVGLHYKWGNMRSNNIDILSYNCQVCHFRKALNDKFDFDLRRITISSTSQIDQDYIYTIPENSDVYLGTLYIEQDFNYVAGTVDFIVNVPLEIFNLQFNEINALVNFYCLAGKSFKIIQI